MENHTHNGSTNDIEMASAPPVPPKDSPAISLVTKFGLKRNPTKRWETLSATTTTPSQHPHQQQTYAELARGNIPPEVVVKFGNNPAHSTEKIPVANDQFSSQHQANPEVNYAELAPGGAPPQARLEPDNYPQVAWGGDLPEALNQQAAAPDDTGGTTAPKTICGLRQRWFWLILATAILVTLIAAIVGGVVGSRASTAAASPKTTSFLPTTSLAALNYTGANGIRYHHVYFQAPSTALYQSIWNSSAQSWHVSPLNPSAAPGPSIAPGTPLAAYTRNDGTHSPIEHTIFFLDPAAHIWSRASTNPANMWQTPQPATALNGTLFASNTSRLAAYAQQCPDHCAQTSLLAYQDVDDALWWAAWIDDYGWFAQAAKADGNHSLVAGSGLALAPVWEREQSRVALWGNAAAGGLVRFVWWQLTAWEESWAFNRSFAGRIEPDAGIASFALGYNGANDSMSDMEVLVTESGGVTAWDSNFSARNYTKNEEAGKAFSSVESLGAVTASAGGRVYAVQGEEIVEWEWQHGNRTFTRVGVVNTEITV